MAPAAMPASPPSQIQPPKSARRSYLIAVLCDADVAVDAETLAVPFRVLRDAGITVNFASPSGCIRLAPAFDAGESSSKTAPSSPSPSPSPSSFAEELMKRARAHSTAPS